MSKPLEIGDYVMQGERLLRIDHLRTCDQHGYCAEGTVLWPPKYVSFLGSCSCNRAPEDTLTNRWSVTHEGPALSNDLEQARWPYQRLTVQQAERILLEARLNGD